MTSPLVPQKNNSFCSFPWTGIQVHVSGQVRPCCMMDDIGIVYQSGANLKELLKNPRLDTIKKTLLRGEKPHECRACYEEDRLGIASVRLLSPPLPAHHEQVAIDRAEVSLTNSCNLDCVMCRPDFSGKVARNEQEYLIEQKRSSEVRSFSPFTVGEEDVDGLIEQFRAARECRLIGGEPLMTKAGRRWIRLWAERGFEGRLEIVTNGTYLDADILSDLKKIKNLLVNISVDGHGKTYEWIRGHAWNQMESRILRAHEVVPVKLTPTVQVYNLLNLSELSRFCGQHGVRVRLAHALRHPHHLSALLWPLALRRSLAQEAAQFWGEDHQDLVDFLEQPETGTPDLGLRLHNWTEFMNKKRGLRWQSLHPWHEELASYMDGIEPISSSM